jgi:hypothetical protein
VSPLLPALQARMDSQASALGLVRRPRVLWAEAVPVQARVGQRAEWQALSGPRAQLPVSALWELVVCSARAACQHQAPRELCS